MIANVECEINHGKTNPSVTCRLRTLVVQSAVHLHSCHLS